MSLLHRDLPQPPPAPRLSPRPCTGILRRVLACVRLVYQSRAQFTCAHAQAHADLRIIKDYYFCFPYVRAAASAARASMRTGVRTFARTTVSGTGLTAYPCPNPREPSV